ANFQLRQQHTITRATPKAPHSLGTTFQLLPVALVRSLHLWRGSPQGSPHCAARLMSGYCLDMYSTHMAHPYMLDHFHVHLRSPRAFALGLSLCVSKKTFNPWPCPCTANFQLCQRYTITHATPKAPHSLGPAFQLFPVALIRSLYLWRGSPHCVDRFMSGYCLDMYSTHMAHPYMLDHFHVRLGV
ncbi:hypothetical protein H5410_041827, partial [Solanum commersonii]